MESKVIEVSKGRAKRAGTRCKVCRFCSRCFEPAPSAEDVDATTAATNIAEAAASFERGNLAPPPAAASPGVAPADEGVDTSTGATPGVSAACREFGMDDSLSFAEKLGIKPPGVA